MKKVTQKQTHGAKLDDIDTVANLLSKHKKQSTASVKEYSNFISNLSTDELHRHSLEAGEIPVEDTNKLISRLVKRFEKTLGKNIVERKEFDTI